MGSFNTVNGKYYCNQQQALTMKKANTCFNTAGGRCCCNNVKVLDTFMEGDCVVSIPQAVGVVATNLMAIVVLLQVRQSFNTASGRCCCNPGDYVEVSGQLSMKFQYRRR